MSFHKNIIELAKGNSLFRDVLATTTHSQLVLMSVPAGLDLGMEVHKVDQILIFVEGLAQATVNGKTFNVEPNDLVLVTAGTEHNFKNIGTSDLKLFTIYAPPQHKAGTIDRTKEDAEKHAY